MGYRDACNDCHSRKVKCEQGPTGGACLNCQNAGKECVYGSTRVRLSSVRSELAESRAASS